MVGAQVLLLQIKAIMAMAAPICTVCTVRPLCTAVVFSSFVVIVVVVVVCLAPSPGTKLGDIRWHVRHFGIYFIAFVDSVVLRCGLLCCTVLHCTALYYIALVVVIIGYVCVVRLPCMLIRSYARVQD